MPNNNSSRRCRNWCWTLNNYSDDDQARIQDLANHSDVTYICYGREVAASGTRHLQGYIELSKSYRFNAIRNLLGGGAHVEPRRGTSDQAREYCFKDDEQPFVSGVPSSKRTGGARSGFQEAVDRITDGATTRELANEFPSEYVRYSRGFERLGQRIHGSGRIGDEQRVWLYGGTGVGKSHMAWNVIQEDPDAWYCKPPNKWWDNYDGQRGVFIDELRGDSAPFHYWLRVFDKYPCWVETKGGGCALRANWFIVATPRDIEGTFAEQTDEDIEQMKRRFTEVYIDMENREHELQLLKTRFTEEEEEEEIDLNKSDSD